jgi:hypothetical protein
VPLRTPGLPVEASRQGLWLWTRHDRAAPDFGLHKLLRVDTDAAVLADGNLGVPEGAVRAALYGVAKAPQLLETEDDRALLWDGRPVLRREPAADAGGLWAWRWYDVAADLDAPAPAGTVLVTAAPYDYPTAVREARYARMAALTGGGPAAHLQALREADHLCQVRAVANCARFAICTQPADGARVATCIRCRGLDPAVGVTAALAWLG